MRAPGALTTNGTRIMLLRWASYKQDNFTREQLELSVRSARVSFPDAHFVVYTDEPKVTEAMIGDAAKIENLELATQQYHLFSKWFPWKRLSDTPEIFIDRDCMFVGECKQLKDWAASPTSTRIIISRDRPNNYVYGLVGKVLRTPIPLCSGIVGQRGSANIGREIVAWRHVLLSLSGVEHGMEQGAIAAIANREGYVVLDESYAICSSAAPPRKPLAEYDALHFTWGQRNEDYVELLPELKQRCGMTR